MILIRERMGKIKLKWIMGILGIAYAGYLLKNEHDKRKKGIFMSGLKKSEKVLPGRPNWYMVTVEIVLAEGKVCKKIITGDKRIQCYHPNEQLSVIYVEKTGKLYWADERRNDRMILAALILVICVMLLLFWTLEWIL